MIHFGPADWWQPCGSHVAATSLGITIPLLCLKANIKPARVNPILALAGIPFSYRISGAAIFTKLSPIKSQYSKRFVGEINNPVIAPFDYSLCLSLFLPGLEFRGVGCPAPFCSYKPYTLIHGIYKMILVGG